MKSEFEELFEAFQNLEAKDKEQAIINFLKDDIGALNEFNSLINVGSKDFDNISNTEIEDKLDVIYKLLHIFTEQVENVIEYTSTKLD